MADPVLLVLLPGAVLLGAGAVVELRAVLVAVAAGAPTASAWLAPPAEAARWLRSPRQRRDAVAGAALVVVAVLEVAAVAVDPPGGLLVVAGLDAVGAVAVLMASRRGLQDRRRVLGRAASFGLPLLVAGAGPAISAGSMRFGDVVDAQRGLWSAAAMPVALLVVLLLLAVRPPPGGGGAVLAAGRAALLVSGAVLVTALFLGGCGPVGWVGAALALVLLERAIPAVPAARLAAFARRALLPLALVQAAVVVLVRLLLP